MKQPLPPITPYQFITILEEMCMVGCCQKFKKTIKKQRLEFYQLSINDVYEGDVIIAGSCRSANTPPSTLQKPAIKSLAVGNEGPPPALTPKQFIAMLDEMCGVAEQTRSNHNSEEIYQVCSLDIVHGLQKLFSL